MPKRKTPEIKPEDQFKQFQRAAKEHGLDESAAEEAARAFGRIARPDLKKPSSLKE